MENKKTLLMPDGVTLGYRVSRNGTHPRGLIVLLHGLGSNLTRWTEFVAHTELTKSWDVLRLDLRGHGESFTRSPIGMRRWYNDLVAVVDAEQHTDAVVVGHSLGAHVALNFAAHYPERTRGLVLIDPAFPAALRGRRRLYPWARPLLAVTVGVVRFMNALGFRRRHIPPFDLFELDRETRTELLATDQPQEFIRRYSSFWGDVKYFPVAHYLQEMNEMLRPLPALSNIRAPMLVMLSTGETHTDPLATRRLIAQAPRAETETIHAYHWPLTEKPIEVREMIERWCERLVKLAPRS